MKSLVGRKLAVKTGALSLEMDEKNIPRLCDHLPEMVDFLSALVAGIESGEIDSWTVFGKRVRTFFTAERMARVEAVAPGWREMVSYGNGVTMVHVMSVFAALFMLPEYRKALPEQQALMEWVVLFHDIAKRVERGERDFTHGFRSAATAAQALPGLGFVVWEGYNELIECWAGMTREAITRQDGIGEAIQDNRQLPDILAGIDRMFGPDTPPALVVKAVLLHMSINVVKDWPQAAPLSEGEIKAFISEALCPLLDAITLVDNDAWAMFEPATKARYGEETLEVFQGVRRIISS